MEDDDAVPRVVSIGELFVIIDDASDSRLTCFHGIIQTMTWQPFSERHCF